MKRRSLYRYGIKRILDIFLSLTALIVLSPVFIIVSILVRLFLGAPVIYTQERPGKNERVFKLFKFRSMKDERDENGELLPDTMRLTKFGRVLRATSIDELPEMVNILKGDMSFVGPRPLAVVYLPYYTNKEKHRHDVRPGLTGLAQVSGRNSIHWKEKFEYDLQYIEELSFLNDVRIFILTIKKVFIREGIGQAEEAPVSLHIERENWLDEEGKIKREYQEE